MNQSREVLTWKVNGFLMLLVHLILLVAGAGLVLAGHLIGIVLLILFFVTLPGYTLIQPNEARVLLFFGKYVGSVREDGFFWLNPFAAKKKISLRVRNFQSDKLKVNDADGNPILIGAVIVWRVVDSAKALLDVEDFDSFVAVQSETAIRAIASRYPYDRQDDAEISLRTATDDVTENLREELGKRLAIAGVEVLEARISHLAYAPEIAQSMLRRQQAQAVIAARKQIVEGAMSMVEMTLSHLEKQGVVQLDEERKAAMANNLMVALVSESESQPVINTGTLYS
ncbi:SPFH domain-containing protein [Thermoactinomyces intermedius]|jgi:regulator of protease activity HflC (stomatin/prohibitin superfamily)|uniref:SPFH domain-containing protein n=1 Tax=Thermoactinomyces intermedius TaxID=2024 RepID=A0A8I1DAY9_THEIN|nr:MULTISPECIES: SPFH domain-containing protein [Thermoactinomyces]MBA4547936.1 SPFH domain-containing protein [Thermoactinomyces intermedius]MBA4835962.1 SPFH domain-containing protein [Thermoactinomyces intermedius]MBH8593833.1 SPFH domain-containing protein [Thermoactinomyces intermedius]MBH8599880.1 SPFH domain-containing protein [Thermoactinomyces sp. CICC 23799]